MEKCPVHRPIFEPGKISGMNLVTFCCSKTGDFKPGKNPDSTWKDSVPDSL
jgi:hypothetical protein